MRVFVVKWLPGHILQGQVQPAHSVIHLIKMPDVSEPNFYRHVGAWNAWAHGAKKAGVSKEDRAAFRINGPWAPNGLYYTHDHDYGCWIKKCDGTREFQKDRLSLTEAQLDKYDERNFPRVEHDDIHAFFAHIGWDHPKRRYAY